MFFRWAEIRKVCNTFETNEQLLILIFIINIIKNVYIITFYNFNKNIKTIR